MQTAAAAAKAASGEERKAAMANAEANKNKDGQLPADTAIAALASADKPLCRSFD